MYLTDIDLDILKKLGPFKCNRDINFGYTEKIDIPNLVSCEHIYADSATTLNLPKLESCRYIYAESATTVDLPKLVSCSGNIYADSATTLNLPKLERCLAIYVGRNTKKIIIPQNLKNRLQNVPDDCEIIHPQTEPKLESFKQYFFRICT
jgi:hypothetical protein